MHNLNIQYQFCIFSWHLFFIVLTPKMMTDAIIWNSFFPSKINEDELNLKKYHKTS